MTLLEIIQADLDERLRTLPNVKRVGRSPAGFSGIWGHYHWLGSVKMYPDRAYVCISTSWNGQRSLNNIELADPNFFNTVVKLFDGVQ